MTSKEIVKKKFPVAQIYKRFTDGICEIWADGSCYPLPNYLGEGLTEQEAWDNVREVIENEKHPKELMEELIKQLCGGGHL